MNLHVNPRDDVKTVRVDLFAREQLQAGRNSRLALVARLLERGNQRLPDLRCLNQFVDDLYGAEYAVDVEHYGDRHALHLYVETLAPRLLPNGEDLLPRVVAFLHDVLRLPLVQDGAFQAGALAQEKSALDLLIAAQLNDRLAYAQQRCLELMCAGEACALSPLGESGDLPGIEAGKLLEYFHGLLARAPIDVYVSGSVDVDACLTQWRSFFDWPRSPEPGGSGAPVALSLPVGNRSICEPLGGTQARLVMGYRTGVAMADPDYPALLLANQILGGDGHSRLFRALREQAGLCYHIASHLEAMSGLLFVAAGVEPADLEVVSDGVAHELAALQNGGGVPGELQGARALLTAGLLQLGEEPGGLVHFHYCHRLAASGLTYASLTQRLDAVELADIQRVARGIRPHIAYLAHGAADQGIVQ
jgi:predicted Zn-dependent peptidase